MRISVSPLRETSIAYIIMKIQIENVTKEQSENRPMMREGRVEHTVSRQAQRTIGRGGSPCLLIWSLSYCCRLTVPHGRWCIAMWRSAMPSRPGDPRRCAGWRQGGAYWWDGSEPHAVETSRSGLGMRGLARGTARHVRAQGHEPTLGRKEGDNKTRPDGEGCLRRGCMKGYTPHPTTYAVHRICASIGRTGL